MEIDPVCGMHVDETQSTLVSHYEGKNHYFCSQGCKIAFDRMPQRWLTHIIFKPAEKVESVIRLTDLQKTYQRGQEKVHALRGLNLEIGRSEFMTVMGSSGGGKSTLLHMIGGIDRPTAGNIWVDGIDISQANENELTRFRREKIGFIFQFYNLLPTLSALENVELPLVALGYPRQRRRKMAAEILDVVGLGDRRDHKPNELSGGQQQRVAIARAIVANPSIVLADEPTGDLDSVSAQMVIELMESIHQKQGMTFVMVTHDRGIGERGTRRLYMRDGQIVADEEQAQHV